MLRIFREAGGGSLLGGCAGATSSVGLRVGNAGFASSAKLFLLAGLDGILGGPLGLGGIFGARSRWTTGGSLVITGSDFAVMRGALAAVALAFSSNSRRVGGRGGSFVSCRGGGSFLADSTDDALVVEDPVWLKDIPETVELNDSVDSFDPLLTICVDAFRGGSIGDGCEALRPGNGGGAFRAGRGGVFALCVGLGLSLSTGGGGSRLPFTPIGWLFTCFVTEEPYVAIGGLFAVWVLEGIAGRLAGAVGGSGGGARLPNV